MSQSTSQSIAPAGFSARPAWVSDATLTRCVPWFRAVLDSMLVTFGVFLALNLIAGAGSIVFVSWKVTAFQAGRLTLGVAGAAIVYFTARSNRRRERQGVLVCLSIVLLLISGLSLVSMLLIRWPDLMNDLRMLVAGVTSGVLICIGMIAVEKRLLSGSHSAAVVERIASGRQTLGRVFWGGLASMTSLTCVLTPAFLAHGVYSGSLWDCFQTDFGEPLNSINYLSLILLIVGANLYQISMAHIGWCYLANFHRPKSHSFKELFRGTAPPAYVVALFCSVGSVAYLMILHTQCCVAPNSAPWALFAVVISSCFVYRKAAAKVAAEMSD